MNTTIDIENYGYIPHFTLTGNHSIPARITACHKNKFEFVCDYGTGLAHLKSSSYFAGDEAYPTTGDFVLVDYRTDGESIILKTLPRKSSFRRLDPSSSGTGAQIVAANFDYVFIIQSLNHNFNPNRLTRYLTLAWESGATPVIVLTKADVAEHIPEYISAASQACPGVDVLAVSAKTGFGMEQLQPYLKKRTTIVLLGSSGVGKSSLVNALAGAEIMDTNQIRESDSRGRHTTTHRQLIMLDSGVMVIDTPGMRSLGIWDAANGLENSFADVEQYFGTCKFRNCRHQSEPGCAVKAALESGELSQKRWNSYLKLKKESSYSEGKGDHIRQKQQRNIKIAKQKRHSKKISKQYQS